MPDHNYSVSKKLLREQRRKERIKNPIWQQETRRSIEKGRLAVGKEKEALIDSEAAPPSKPRVTSRKTREFSIADRLAKDLRGQVEIAVPDGTIDVLTSTEIIEVKAARDWKSGLGQLLVYSFYYPRKERRLHLFTRNNKDAIMLRKDVIAAHCQRFEVKVTWECLNE